MSTIIDEEFGRVTIRRSPKATHVRIRVAPDGTLRASLPLYAPLFLVKQLLKTSRSELRSLLTEYHGDTVYSHGDRIGKSHTIFVRPTPGILSIKHVKQQIIVTLPEGATLDMPVVSRHVRDAIAKALRIEAKAYLPKRLAFLADQHGFSYEKVRFSHASGRWGSCSSNGTISLNIALMKLPFELIDYVLIHELCHTREMNHSEAFWGHVRVSDPLYHEHRRRLKLETPSV